MTMGNWRAQFDTEALKRFTERVEGIDERGQNLKLIHDGEFHDLHNAQMRRMFFSQGATSKRGSWRPKKPSRTRTKGTILVDTGDLRESYTDPSSGTHVWESTNTGVRAGSRHRLARIHERGTRTIPRRSIEKSQRDNLESLEVIKHYILTGEGKTR